jgi:DNA-binding FadR family transcriptional regulator
LPTERHLAEEFGVTRHVVREALKRLEAVGLVRIRQGSGIFVQNLQLTAGVELFDVLLMHEDGSIDVDFLRDVFEFRDKIIQLVVRLAAARRTEEEAQRLHELDKKRRRCMSDPMLLDTATSDVYGAIAQASHNRIFVLMFNTMGRILLQLRHQFESPVMGSEKGQQILERIVEAIENRDPDMAGLLAVRHVNVLRNALLDGAGTD